MASIYRMDVKEVKKLMIEKGINTISQLSQISNIDRNTLGKVLNGSIQPSSEVMDKLVLSLEIPAEKAGIIFFNQNLRTA